MIVYNALERIKQEYSEKHRGIDLGWNSSYTEEQNYHVYANCEGTVAEIQTGIPNDKGCGGVRSWGNYVLVRHPNGMYSRYAHLKEVYVNVGDNVNESTLLGYMGETGNAYGVHLHFEVQTGYSSNTRINPKPYLSKKIYEKEETAYLKYKIGDIISVKGYGCSSSTGNQPYTKNFNQAMKIVKIAPNTPYPYGCNQHQENNGVTGWFAESSLTDKNKIEIGDFVTVNGRGCSTSNGGSPYTGTFKNKQMRVVKIVDGKYPYGLNKNGDMNGVTGWFSSSSILK